MWVISFIISNLVLYLVSRKYLIGGGKSMAALCYCYLLFFSCLSYLCVNITGYKAD